MPITLDLAQARASWARAQGLDARGGDTLHDVVASTGWIRTLGGAEAYLALHARALDVTVGQVHEATAEGELQMLPSVRGCMYLVPRADAAVSLRIADRLSARRNARDLDKVGVEPAELDDVGQAVLAAIDAAGALTTHQLRRTLPDGVVRSLGDRGKAVGLSSTLPSALRALEFAGELVRRQVDDRLDHERYSWVRPDVNPLADTSHLDDPLVLHRALALRYFRWAGPATADGFAAWTGLGKRDARAAAASAGLEEVTVAGFGDAWMHPEGLATTSEAPTSRVAWLPALDNLVALPQVPSALVDADDADVQVATFGRPPTGPLGEARHIYDRVLSRGGRIVGLWAWQPASEEVVFRSFADIGDNDAERVAVRDLLRALGTGRRSVLDTDDTLADIASRVVAA